MPSSIPARFGLRILFLSTLLFLAGCATITPSFPVRESSYTSPIKAACVGDSITYEHLSPNRERNSYPAQLAVLLGDKWQVGSFGRSGATVLRKSPRPYHEQPEYRDALAFKPDVVMLQLGTNDTKRETWEAEGAKFASDYLELIRAFQALETNPRILICRPVPLFRDRGKQSWDTDRHMREEILPRIDQVARENFLTTLDLYTTFSTQSALMPDGVHPDARGAALMARTVYAALTGRAAPTPTPHPPALVPKK